MPLKEAKNVRLVNGVSKLPISFGSTLVSLLVLILGIGMRGEWILVAANIGRQLKEYTLTSISADNVVFKDLPYHLIFSISISFLIYFIIGGFLQWYFYIRQRDSSDTWKCQPNKFLSWHDERHEIILGSLNMLLGATLSGIISCYITNGGDKTSFYYRIDEFGYAYFLMSIPVLFIYQDAAAYYVHRILHLPFLYRKFHKMHHRYKQPTAFSATAMHPVEFLIFQLFLALPIVGPPIHWVVYTCILFYFYYYGLLDHSGVNMNHLWPWQPESLFHDDHHKYFHVNFGFNTKIWDRLHGTARKKDRFYSEKIFYGHGKKKEDLTEEDMKHM